MLGVVWLVGVGLFTEGAWRAAEDYRVRRAADTVTTGRYVDVRGRCGRYVEYEVERRTYRLDTATGRRQKCSDVSEGEEIDLFYDSDDPATAHRGSRSPTPFIVLAALSGGSALGLLVVPPYLLLRRRRRANTDPRTPDAAGGSPG